MSYKAIITCSITGVLTDPANHHVPVTPEQLAAEARRAAQLAKNDLQSRMVNEFPELQGIAGRHYALAAGESKEIALAIDEAYQPRFAGDDIALSGVGKVLAIAERTHRLRWHGAVTVRAASGGRRPHVGAGGGRGDVAHRAARTRGSRR